MKKLVFALLFLLPACAGISGDAHNGADVWFAGPKLSKTANAATPASRVPKLYGRENVELSPSQKSVAAELSLSNNFDFADFKRDGQGRIFSTIETVDADVIKSAEIVMGDSIKNRLYNSLSHVNFGYVRVAEESADGAAIRYMPYAVGHGRAAAIEAGQVFKGAAVMGVSSSLSDGSDVRAMELVGSAKVGINLDGSVDVALGFPSYYNFTFTDAGLSISSDGKVSGVFALDLESEVASSVSYDFFGSHERVADEVAGVFCVSQEAARVVEISGAFGAKRDYFDKYRK